MIAFMLLKPNCNCVGQPHAITEHTQVYYYFFNTNVGKTCNSQPIAITTSPMVIVVSKACIHT